MDCPACSTPTVAFAVPEAHREHAPGGTAAAAICPTCLALPSLEDGAHAAGGVDEAGEPEPDDAAFSRVIEGFPEGEAGAAMALAVGLLVDSLVLNRDDVRALFDVVADAGHDPWLLLERLHAAGSVQPDADLAKARHQLEQLWG